MISLHDLATLPHESAVRAFVTSTFPEGSLLSRVLGEALSPVPPPAALGDLTPEGAHPLYEAPALDPIPVLEPLPKLVPHLRGIPRRKS